VSVRCEVEPNRCSVPRTIGVLEAEAAGPTLIVIGGVHGNEPTGVRAAEKVISRLNSNGQIARGRCVALTGHRRALADPDGHTRYLEEDLNRLFTPERVKEALRCNRQSLSPDMIELAEIVACLEAEAERARGPMYLIDIHTFSSRGTPFAATEDAIRARRFCRGFGLPMVLGFEEELHGLLSDYFTNRFGGVSVVVEAGRHGEQAAERIAEATLMRALELTGLIEPGIEALEVLKKAAGARAGRIYDVRYRHVIKNPDFKMLDRVHSFARVHVGEHVADEGGCAQRTPESGLMFMPNRQKHKRPGDDGYFIVRRVGGVWLALSAWLRDRAWIHRALPRFLPGVRRRGASGHELLVSPQIAAVMKRDLFHLLGYRLVRHDGELHLHWARRLAVGMQAIVRSVGLMLAGLVAGGERRILAEESPQDWIVRRHHLDVLDEQDS